jgi:flavin reductase (DIM6/NTAB) family NADH-FMN oxidoreductase RutF
MELRRDTVASFWRHAAVLCNAGRMKGGSVVMARATLKLSAVYQLLEPGPVVLLTTVNRNRPNVMTMSWHTMMEFEPPLVGCVVSGRNHSFAALRRSKECVIAIPTVELAAKVVQCGNVSGRQVDKFARIGLTAVPASTVRAPLIEECWANLECRVADTRMVNRYNLFVLEVVKAWIDRARKKPRTLHHQGRGVFAVDGRIVRLPSRMK